MAFLFKWNWHQEKKLAELHCHTNMGGREIEAPHTQSPEEAVEAAVTRGLDYLCITDHNEIKGAKKAKKYAKKKDYDLEVIIGEEIDTIDDHITAKRGHVVGLGLKKKIPGNIPIVEAVEEIHDQGGFAIAAHPYTYPKSYSLGFKAFTSQFDAVEGFNRENWHLPGEWYARRMSNRYDTPIVPGSDAHTPENVGKCGIIFQGDFFESLRKGHFKWYGVKRNPFKVVKWFLDVNKNSLKKTEAPDMTRKGTRY